LKLFSEKTLELELDVVPQLFESKRSKTIFDLTQEQKVKTTPTPL